MKCDLLVRRGHRFLTHRAKKDSAVGVGADASESNSRNDCIIAGLVSALGFGGTPYLCQVSELALFIGEGEKALRVVKEPVSSNGLRLLFVQPALFHMIGKGRGNDMPGKL